MLKALRATLCSAAWLLGGAAAWAQTCALPGWDGQATPAGVVNSYHGGSGNVAAGATSITVASATGLRTNTRALRAGDLVLVMQMQDSATPANAGLHEYAQVVAITGTTLSLNRPLTNSYAQSMNTTNVRNWQVVWVPQYSSATISGTVNADAFTSSTATGVVSGGVVAIDVAGSLALTGTITAAGAGFRGAYGQAGGNSYGGGTATTANSNYTPTAVYGGQKGEGIQGTPPVVFQGSAAPANYLALLGQGYALGAGGQAAIGNAGGAANDGLPATGGNQYNAGGGGGGNAGAGGQGGNSWNSGNTTTAALNQNQTATQTGNIAGGKGGNAQTNAVTRLVMGGGGGSGSANNATAADAVTAWPPTASSVAANGADGPVTSSGSSGGGVVLVRAGTLTGTGAINASGYRAYNKSPVGDTDAAGGGGAGGSISVLTASGTGPAVNLTAAGGAGGSSNYFNHGPGGGGGGGYILTNFAGAVTNVAGAANGTDGCCGGTAGNGSPKAWNATAGANGATSTAGGSPAGVQGGGSCLPAITVTKSTITPTLTSAPGATATYRINLSNTGGAASNVFILDQALPPGWTYSSAAAPTYTFNPAPPPAANSPAAGAEATSAGAPGALPVTSLTSANSATAVSLRAIGTAPGVAPSTGNNTLSFGSFYLPQNGSITVSFVVSIPSTATAGTYHNPGGVIYLDPTRTSNAVRMVTPLAEASSNRSGTAYSNTAYASGATANVGGANYSGLQAGPTGEDVVLLPDFSVTKTAPASATPGTTFTYTLTARNNGWAIGSQTYALTQATDVSLANVPTQLGSNPLTLTDTLPAGVTITGGVFTGSGWSCTGGTTQVCTLANASAYPIAASTNFASVTATVTLTAVCSGGTTRTNTVTVSAAAGEVNTANNTATATTALTCATANLQVAKTNGTTVVASGGTTGYTVTISNLGPGGANGVVLSDAATSGLSCTTVSCTGFSGALCPAASMPFGSLTAGLTINTFPANSSATFAIACDVTATGS